MKKFLSIFISLIFLLGIFVFVPKFILNSNKGEVPAVYINALNSSHGYGYDSGNREEERHYPMAYALIASAESNRYIYTRSNEALKSTIQNANWLVENRDINENGIIGWGLPNAWDAFSDGSENPAHTEYTITTALVVKGLLDAAEVIEDTGFINKIKYEGNKSLYLITIEEAIDAFIQNGFYNEYENGMIGFWYSSLVRDDYNVTNVHAMFVGQIQRASNYLRDPVKKEFYREIADKGMKYLFNAIVRNNDAWYWNYNNDSENLRENDLVHAAYVADGLLTYKKYNGNLSADIDERKILNGLELFIENNEILEMFSRPDLPVRAWALGYFLYVVSDYYHQEKGIKDLIFSLVLDREEGNGFRFRNNEDSPTNFVRHNTHILLGLSKCLWN